MKSFRFMPPLLPLLALLVFALSMPSAAREVDQRAAVRIGVMSFIEEGAFTTHIADEDALLKRVPQWLSEHVQGVRFEARYYRMNDLIDAIERREVDVFLGSSGLFWQMKHRGVRDLATIVSKMTPNPNEGVAGVIFVRRDRTNLNEIKDLKGLTAATGLPNMFLATQLSMATVAQAGFAPDAFFSSIKHFDLPYPSVVRSVETGNADVGMLRACVLESEYPTWREHLKVIAERRTNGFHCARSTDAYPNWTMAAVSGFDPEVSRQIAVALLTMPPTGEDGFHWTLATDFERVDQVARLLKTDGYAYLKEWTLPRVWSEYRSLIIALVVALLAFLWHVLRVEKLVTRRTRELRQEMKLREETEKSLHEYEERLARARKMNIVGELSSIFAHEIRQPLASVQYLTDGIRVLLHRGSSDREKMQRCVDGIAAQVDRINAVVERVRSYAKETIRRDAPVNLSVLAASVLEKAHSRHPHQRIDADIKPDVIVRGEPIELELALANLLKNAMEAAGTNGLVRVELRCGGDSAARLIIINDGDPITQEVLDRLTEPLQSGKASGLGLGIPIVRSITEAHRGRLSFTARLQGGLEACLMLPLYNQEES